MQAFHLNPLLFGVPQSRPRLYFSGFPATALHALGLDAAGMAQMQTNVMQRLLGSAMIGLDAYLLPESDPIIRRAVYSARALQLQQQGLVGDACIQLGGVLLALTPSSSKLLPECMTGS